MSTDPNALKEALSALDAEDDAHWTNEGLPRIDALSLEDAPTREDIENAAPGFTREVAREMRAASTDTPDSTDPAEPVESAAPTEQQPSDAQAPQDPTESAEFPTMSVHPVVFEQMRKSNQLDAVEDPVDGSTVLTYRGHRLVLDDEADNPYATPAEVDVMSMPFAEVLADEGLLRKVIAELNQCAQDLRTQKAEIDEELEVVYRRSVLASRHLQRFEDAKPNSDTEHVRHYLASQRRANEQRAAKQKALLSGLPVQTLRELAETRSPLDAAMNSRKPALGQTRPAPRAPARVGGDGD